jgi:HEAT repeat protein
VRDAKLRSGKIPIHPRRTPSSVGVSRLASDDGLAALAGALDHPDPDVRVRTVLLVGELADDHALGLLQKMMHDPCPAVRAAAVGAGGRAKRTSVVASLIVALGDPDISVRRAALDAVSRFTGRPLAANEEDARIDRRELVALKQWWKDERFTELSRRGEP